MTDAVTEKWFIGEAVMPKNFKTMEWLPFDEAFERIATHSFLARFDGAPDGPARLAYCVMGEDGNVYALADNSAENEPLNPAWRLVPEPDQILVPTLGWRSDMSKAPRNARLLIKSDPSGEVFAAHWVKNIETDDEAWLISEAADGSQHVCKAKAWRLIPSDEEAANG